MTKKYKNKNILVTGASGMLGFEVTNHLVNQGANVIGLFNNNPMLVDEKIKSMVCNLGDQKSIKSIVGNLPKLDLIFHCASMTGVDKCEKNKKECFSANVYGTRNIVDLAEKNNTKVVYISTGSVFSGEEGNYKEEDIPDPRNYYSFTKSLGEMITLSYKNGIVVRATPIGVHPKGRPQANFLEWIVDMIKNNKPLNFFTDVYINALSAKNMAMLLPELADKINCGVVHLGSEDRLSKADIGLAVASQFKDYSGEIKLVSIDSMPGNFASRPKEMWLNVDKVVNLGLKMPKLKDEILSIFNN